MSFNSDESWANRAAKAVLLIRVLVGWVFLSEGIQKFLFPDSLGVGRFVKIGIPWPQVMAPFISVVEIVCGALLLIGLWSDGRHSYVLLFNGTDQELHAYMTKMGIIA
jgi:uncharacterized membrane protein